MKRVLIALILCLLAVALVGCGATPLTQNQVDLTKAAFTAQEACYDRLTARQNKISEMMSKVPENQVGLLIALEQMQESNKQMMSMVTGNNYNPCDISTGFDVQIAEIKEKNATVRSGVKDGATVGKWIVGGMTINSVVDKVGGVVVNGDNNEMNKDSKNTKIDAGEDAEGVVYQSSAPEKVDTDTQNTDSNNVYNEPDPDSTTPSVVVSE